MHVRILCVEWGCGECIAASHTSDTVECSCYKCLCVCLVCLSVTCVFLCKLHSGHFVSTFR